MIREIRNLTLFTERKKMNLQQNIEKFGLPEFATQKIERFAEREFSEELIPFCSEYYWCNSESINVFDIVGTVHPKYCGLTWSEFINSGKRMKLNISLLESNSIYYRENEIKKPTMYYIELDGKLYVDADGNHRSALAKFYFAYSGLNPILHGVDVKKYTIDYILKDVIDEANSRLSEMGYNYVQVSTKREKISRDDTAGWMREKFVLPIVMKNVITGKEVEINKNELKDSLKKLRKKGFLSGFFNKSLFSGIL